MGGGYLGLLPESKRRNSTPKLPEETRALMAEFISSDYETLKQKTKYASWIALKLACDKRGIVAPSYKTFSLAVGRRPGFEQKLKRQGRRAAYMQEPFYWQLEFRTPRHGDRPFEIGHIDHTELDVESVCSRTGRVLGRTWMTLLTDAFSRRILALYLTFDPPSYRSCIMVLRECVRRHSRLPQIVVVDGAVSFTAPTSRHSWPSRLQDASGNAGREHFSIPFAMVFLGNYPRIFTLQNTVDTLLHRLKGLPVTARRHRVGLFTVLFMHFRIPVSTAHLFD